MAVVFGVNGGIGGSEESEKTQDQGAGIILKPKVIRVGVTAANLAKKTTFTGKEIAEFICKTYALEAGALIGAVLIISYDGKFQSTKVKGEALAFSKAEAESVGEQLASIPGLAYLESGNETSYGYQYGDGFAEESYKIRARTYAERIKTLAEALSAHGSSMKPLCQAEDGGSGSNTWVKEMYTAVPNLHEFVSGWVAHLYKSEAGGKVNERLEHLINQLHEIGGAGADALPIDITEFGVTSDNGNTLSDGTKLNYAEANTLLEAQIAEIKAIAGSRLRNMNYFQARDQREPGTAGENREWYFGALTHGNAEKTGYTPYIKKLMAESGIAFVSPQARINRSVAVGRSSR